MTNAYERIKLPRADRPVQKSLVVPMLARKCEIIANKDDAFRDKKRFEFTDSSTWTEIKTGINWYVCFNAIHSYDEESKPVKSYEIGLTVLKYMLQAPDELRNQISEQDNELLRDDNIKNITFMHHSRYTVSHTASLSWEASRQYIINYVKDPEVEPLLKDKQFLVEKFPVFKLDSGMKTGVDLEDNLDDLLVNVDTERHIQQAISLLGAFENKMPKISLRNVLPLSCYDGNN